MNSGMFDKHSQLFKAGYSEAKPYQEYMAESETGHQSRWLATYNAVSFTENQIELLKSFKRTQHYLILAGSWCGDCARQCPIIERIAEQTTTIKTRYLDNQALPEIRDELRIHGAARVPVGVAMSEDFFEINRFGDRPISVYRRKANTESGAACDIGGKDSALALETADWISHFERLELMLKVSPFLRTRHGD